MKWESRRIASPQSGPHPRLAERVRRHQQIAWRQPVAAHSRAAFDACAARVAEFSGPLVLDSGCGTGASARRLADLHPAALVIGVDKSAARLARGSHDSDLPRNLLLVRAELGDFWRLALQARWRIWRHYLFYPNPWPKPEHLQRRWQGHPVLPVLLGLGNHVELRSNWCTYVEEWRTALHLHGWSTVTAAFSGAMAADSAVSPFERKYLGSGQTCWRCVARRHDLEP